MENKEEKEVIETTDVNTEEVDDSITFDDLDDSQSEATSEVEDNESEETEDDTENESADDKAKREAKEKQTREQNAKYAEMRRKAEEKEKAEKAREAERQRLIKEASDKATIEALGVNPYTNKPMKDSHDVELYKIQKEIEARGGDPVEDLIEELAERERKKEALKLQQAKELEESEKAIKKDIEDFHKAYPKVNTAELASDKDYMKFANDKIGRWSTIEIYEAYVAKQSKLKEAKEDAEIEKDAKKFSTKQTKVPSSSGEGKVHKKISEMTLEEYEQYSMENDPNLRAKYGFYKR